MRQLKYYIACTVDRFIAREDGTFDFFLADEEHLTDLLENFPETIPAHFRDRLGITAGNRHLVSDWMSCDGLSKIVMAAASGSNLNPDALALPYSYLDKIGGFRVGIREIARWVG